MEGNGQIVTPEKAWPVWAKAFLSVLSRLGVVGYAARKAGIERQSAYHLRDRDDAFREAWRVALEEAMDRAEQEAWRRGIKGVKRPVYQGGEHVGDIQDYSDTLLIFMMKAHRPEKYRERIDMRADMKHEHSGEVTFKIEDAVKADKELEVWERGSSLHERNGDAHANGSAQVP